jgi:hypothetical protein
MLVENRNHSNISRGMPRWQEEYNRYHRNASLERSRFDALVLQISHEMESLTKLVNGGGKREAIDQATAICAKLLGRIEQHLADAPELRDRITDPLILAALDKRTKRRELAQQEVESQTRNELQARWNELIGNAERDVFMVQSFANASKLDASFHRTLGRRMKETAIAMVTLARSPEGATIDMTGMSQATLSWFQRTTALLDAEHAKETSNGE